MTTKMKAPAADRRSVSYQLREAIEADGRTAYALGQEAEVDPGMVQRFLNGERGLSLATVDRLALALGLRLVEGARGRGRPAKPRRPSQPEPVADDDLGQSADDADPPETPTAGQMADTVMTGNDGFAEAAPDVDDLRKPQIGPDHEQPPENGDNPGPSEGLEGEQCTVINLTEPDFSPDSDVGPMLVNAGIPATPDNPADVGPVAVPPAPPEVPRNAFLARLIGHPRD